MTYGFTTNTRPWTYKLLIFFVVCIIEVIIFVSIVISIIAVVFVVIDILYVLTTTTPLTS
jgi:hypothetical protein